MNSRKHPRNKLMIVAGFGFIVLFALFLITKNFLPDAGGGWSEPPIFDYFYMLGMGICFSILGIGYTYFHGRSMKKIISNGMHSNNLLAQNGKRISQRCIL